MYALKIKQNIYQFKLSFLDNICLKNDSVNAHEDQGILASHEHSSQSSATIVRIKKKQEYINIYCTYIVRVFFYPFLLNKEKNYLKYQLLRQLLDQNTYVKEN